MSAPTWRTWVSGASLWLICGAAVVAGSYGLETVFARQDRPGVTIVAGACWVFAAIGSQLWRDGDLRAERRPLGFTIVIAVAAVLAPTAVTVLLARRFLSSGDAWEFGIVSAVLCLAGVISILRWDGEDDD